MSRIRNIERNEYQLIGDIIGASFADDPVNLWVFGSASPMPLFFALEAKKLYLKRGFGHVTANCCAGSLWLPPGMAKHIPLWNSLDIATMMIRNGGFSSILRGIQVDENLAKKQPVDPHFYLHAIGAIPAHQGKGLGGKLMAVGLERVDSESMPAYLECSKEKNVAFYRHFGFEVMEEYMPAKGCPPLWLMWRDPR